MKSFGYTDYQIREKVEELEPGDGNRENEWKCSESVRSWPDLLQSTKNGAVQHEGIHEYQSIKRYIHLYIPESCQWLEILY